MMISSLTCLLWLWFVSDIGSELSAEAQQEARGVVSFKGCKLGVDQTTVQDPRSYAEQLIQGVIGIILNLDAGYDMMSA